MLITFFHIVFDLQQHRPRLLLVILLLDHGQSQLEAAAEYDSLANQIRSSAMLWQFKKWHRGYICMNGALSIHFFSFFSFIS